MRVRILAAFSVAVLALGLCVAESPAPAAAVTQGVPVSADALPTWQTDGVVWGMAATAGKLVAGGSFGQLRPGSGQSGSPRTQRALAIFNAATGVPDSCQFALTFGSSNPIVYAVAAAPTGNTVFVGGNFSTIGGVAVARLAEIDVVQCRVTSFRPGAISSTVLSIAPTADAVYFGGAFQTVAGQSRRSFAKVSRAGALQSWVANASGTTVDKYTPTILPTANSRGTAVTVSPDGAKVALGGDFFTVNGQNTHSIAVVSGTDGGILRTYPNFVQNTSRTQSLVSDGVNFYGGNEGSNAFDGRFAVSWDTLNQVWRDICLGAVQTMVVAQGLLFSGHHNHDCAAMGMFPDGRRTYVSVSRTADPAQAKLGWSPELNDGTGEGLGPRSMAMARSGSTDYLWVGGEFTRVNGSNQQALTRFGPTDTGAPPVPAITARAVTPGAIQVNIRGVYDNDDEDLTYAVYRGANTTTPVWTGTARAQWWFRPQITFVDTVSPGTTNTYRVRVIDRAGNQSGLSTAASATASGTASAYASTVIADGPRLYYRYDDIAGSTWVLDSSGQTTQGLNGTADNGVTRGAAGAIPGDASRSATFNDALAQYIWNDQPALGPATYTIETWFRTSSTTGGSMVNYGNGRPRTDTNADTVSSSYNHGDNPWTQTTSTYDRVVYMEASTGRIRFGVRAPSAVQTLRTDAAYNDNQWHHLVATQGAEGMRLYIDGAIVGQNAISQNRAYYGMWRVGGDNLNGFPSSGTSGAQANRFFDGQLDETAIYTRPLTAAQVSAHYGAVGGQDLQAPTVPAGVQAVQTGAGAATVSWAASTDASGIASYAVYRGSTAGFTPSAANLVNGSVTTASLVENGVPAGTWHYRVTARDTAGNVSAPSTAGTVTIGAPDTTVPSTPSGLAATVSSSDVGLSWAAATDNVAVAGYSVYRGTSAGFTANAASKIADVAQAGYVDASRPAGTWFYRVAAVDSSGNLGAATGAVSATVNPVVAPTSITVVPTEDSMTAQSVPTTLYGTTNQLSSRLTQGTLESFIRVAVPAAPAGTQLVSATLNVRTSDDATAASAESHAFHLVSDSWVETAITWNNRPTTVSSGVLGSLTGATALNTAYQVGLDPTALQATLGTTITLRMSGAGADNVRLWSAEASQAQYRPSIVFSFAPTP
ncbi:LamG-like jellyroll fold domain-containing protein [Microbacterium sp.]|uniref:LamG-like jellyroll fold domain-containing protein n=1 Tax=Microbacterium sp. TaxID=51671 RepID=UPI0037CC116A